MQINFTKKNPVATVQKIPTFISQGSIFDQTFSNESTKFGVNSAKNKREVDNTYLAQSFL